MWDYIIESYRNKKNRPLSFFVNWLGLTLGLAAVIVIYLYVMQELRHDNGVFDSDMTLVYRIENNEMGAYVPTALNGVLSELAEVETSSRLLKMEYPVSTTGDDFRIASFDMIFCDTTIFKVLPFKFLAGDPSSVFQVFDNVIVTRSTAEKLFSTTDVIGKTVKINGKIEVQITGVIEDVGANSTLTPDIIAASRFLHNKLWGNNFDMVNTNWGQWNEENYLKLRPCVNIEEFQVKFKDFIASKMSSAYGDSEHGVECSLRPFNDVYFSGGSESFYTHAKMVDKQPIMIMVLIAILVLVIAIINYVNIYTARSTEVIRAMGIKSIMGAKRVQLIAFVLFDSIVITLLSAISAFILAWCLEPNYIDIIGSYVSLRMTWDLILIIFVAVPMVCGIISGVFPAIALTRMQPLDAMANRSSGGRAMGYVRNALIVFQFIITITLIGSTLFINKQIHYISLIDMGYNRENILIIDGTGSFGAKFEVFREKLLENPNITHVSANKNSPVNVTEMQTFRWGDSREESFDPNIMRMDENTFELLGLELLEGEMLKFSRTEPDKSILVNEAMAKLMRATNPEITFPFKNFKGVFKDFHSSSAKEPVKPLTIADLWLYGPNTYFSGYVKINGNDFENTLQFIEKTHKELYPNSLYSARFMDNQFNELYQNELLFRARLLIFSILAIFISCLGLFALVSYSIERRRKEIAIRKVYGSTVMQVLRLLTVSFMRWLVVAFLVAAPAIYFISSWWISQFHLRTDMTWWIYGIALGVTLIVAFATMLTQAYIAATENPARNVKAE